MTSFVQCPKRREFCAHIIMAIRKISIILASVIKGGRAGLLLIKNQVSCCQLHRQPLSFQTDMTCHCDSETEGGGGCDCDVRWPRNICPQWLWNPNYPHRPDEEDKQHILPGLGCKNMWSNIILRQFRYTIVERAVYPNFE